MARVTTRGSVDGEGMLISSSKVWLLFTVGGGTAMGKQQTSDTGGKVLSAETAGGCYRVGGVGTAMAAGCWGTVARVPKKARKG